MSCSDEGSVDGGYPVADYRVAIGGTLPDWSFDSLPGKVALRDYYEPCAPRARLLVVRVGAPWCGTCRWHLAHTGELGALDIGPRLRWLDLLVSDRDNDPPQTADIPSYRALIDAPDAIAIDPNYAFGSVDPGRGSLPLVVLVDTRTMTVRSYLHDPDPQLLELRLRQELAALDRLPEPAYPPLERFDGVFTRNQWSLLHDMTLPGAPPAEPSNAKADDPAAAALGKALFQDVRLSPSGKVACGSCHDATRNLQDGLPQSTGGVATVDRNSPSVALAAHARWQLWDGRADTLWMQALGPLEDAREFGGTRLFVAHAVAAHYPGAYASVFGPLPDLADVQRFPSAGRPGDPTWEAMSPGDRQATTTIFMNVGKAIAAYERTLRVKPNRLDAYIGGDLGALSPDEKSSLSGFFVNGCAQCHWGPRLTDDAFHPDRYPTGRQDGQADRGRIDGIARLASSEFVQPSSSLVAHAAQLGSFKTAPLRGVAGSAPYGHGGTLATLQEAARNYGTAGLPMSDPRAVGATERWLPEFAQSHADALVPFLQVLTAEPEP